MSGAAVGAPLPRRMRAAVLHAWNDLRVEEVEVPAVGPGEVLCRVRACGICGTDLKLAEGAFAGVWPPALPFIPGHEWAGEVAAVGQGVTGLAVGDRIAAENHSGCGHCPMCRSGRYNLCEAAARPGAHHRLYGHTAPGAFAEYAARPALLLHQMPPGLGFEEGVIANQAATALNAARRSRIEPGNTVAVLGPGLMGLLALQIAAAMGAYQVIVLGTGRSGRLALAAELGASAVIDVTRENPAQRVRELTAGRGVDVAVECAGTPEAVRTALQLVRRGGRVGLTGLTGRKEVRLVTDRLVLDELDIFGVRSAPNLYADALRLIASGRVDARRLVTHRFPLEDIAKGYDLFRQRESGAIRVVIQI